MGLSRDKEKQFKLSYESDGEMGENTKNNNHQINQTTEIAEEFFNTTQNSE